VDHGIGVRGIKRSGDGVTISHVGNRASSNPDCPRLELRNCAPEVAADAGDEDPHTD
jgi:hypothetical protein